MATIKLKPSHYDRSNTSYVTVTDPANMYYDTSHVGSYCTIRGRAGRSSNSTYYAFINGFDFSSVPADAIVNSFTIRIKCYRNQYENSGSSYRMRLCSSASNSNVISGTTATVSIDITASVITIPTGSLTWEQIKNYGRGFSIEIRLRNTSTSSSNYPYVYVYGAEIEVDYTQISGMDIYGPYYIQASYGGYSPCIEGNNAYGLRPFAGSVLPNCVGFTVGHFNEMLNEGACTWLGNTDAKNQLALAQSQGLNTGDDPVVGGVICWDSADNGHCAVIEQVIDNDTVITSESGSNYTSDPIVTINTRYRVNGAWVYGSGYTYQGVIYPPGYPPTPGPGTGSDGWYIFFHEVEK